MHACTPQHRKACDSTIAALTSQIPAPMSVMSTVAPAEGVRSSRVSRGRTFSISPQREERGLGLQGTAGAAASGPGRRRAAFPCSGACVTWSSGRCSLARRAAASGRAVLHCSSGRSVRGDCALCGTRWRHGSCRGGGGVLTFEVPSIFVALRLVQVAEGVRDGAVGLQHNDGLRRQLDGLLRRLCPVGDACAPCWTASVSELRRVSGV